jgi:hypothetical protein
MESKVCCWRSYDQNTLTIAALNNLDILAGDAWNAYLCAPVSVLIWTTCGVELGANYKKTAIIVRALYGLKSACAAFRNHLAVCMTNMGYKSCLADPDVWYHSSVRGTDNHEYYKFVLIYMDDILCMSHDQKESTRRLDKFFPMKVGSIGPRSSVSHIHVLEETTSHEDGF